MTKDSIAKAQQATALTLGHMLTQANNELTQIQLEEMQELASEIGRVLPAGNVVQMVFSQLRSANSRRMNHKDSKRIMSLLQQGISTMLDKASYLAFYTTPALLISGYQMLLQAAGKDPEASFPEGVWQFYLEFGLREDTARHATETHGFHNQLSLLYEPPSLSDQLAACLLSCIDLLYMYPQLLTEEWHERRLLHRLGEQLDDERMVHRWLARRPYGVPKEWDWEYIAYRREEFNAFVRERLLTQYRGDDVEETISFWAHEETLADDLRSAYQDQMSLLAYLEPTTYNDERVPLELADSFIGVVWHDRYYLVPIAHHGRRLPAGIIRTLAHAMMTDGDDPPVPNMDDLLVRMPRGIQEHVRSQLPKEMRQQLELLRRAPIIVNWDEVSSELPLAYIRQGRRGIGDHPLTVFRTEKSLVFDQSHIFFDATWGMAVAEIATNLASRHLRAMPPDTIVPSPNIRPRALDLELPSKHVQKIEHFVSPTEEVAAEITSLVVMDMNRLRELLVQRNPDLQLTINDLLVLYRSFYNQVYQPSEDVWLELQRFSEHGSQEKAVAEKVWQKITGLQNEVPAVLIPIDASAMDPRARLFPITFWPRPPWTEITDVHQRVWGMYQEMSGKVTKKQWERFQDDRTYYWQLLRMFGVLMQRYKEIALEGKSFSTMTLKILAGVPRSLQEMLRNIPDRIDVLNDLLKGTEVFSNVGRVADTSSLVRFITAKDDNQKKELCWGIMTRADNVMVVSLRDFRGEVVELKHMGAEDLAHKVTYDFLQGYIHGLEQFVLELDEISRLRRPR